MMKRKIGFISAVGGAISSIIGVIGVCFISPPLCGGICIAGPLAAIFGISVVGYLYKHSIWFIVVGGIIFIFGLFLIIKNRRKCTPARIKSYLRNLKKYYEIEKCRTCDCFQGLLTQLQIDEVDDKTKEEIKKMIIFKEKMHGCLGCKSCPPAELFSSYIRDKKCLDNKKSKCE